MRFSAVLCVLVSVASIADADTLRTIQAVTVRKKPGEKEAAVAKIPANTDVRVIATEGRWLKIRVNGVEGYITRTTVITPTPTMAPSGTWSAARHPGAEPITELFVEVTAPSSLLLAEPKAAAAKVSDVAQGVHLAVIDAATTPGWIHARDDQGHDGWIARTQVENGATSVSLSSDLVRPVAVDDFVRPAPRRVAMRSELGFAYRSLGMDLTTNAQGGLSNYLVDADAMMAVLGVDGTLRLTGRTFVAADIRTAISTSSPGIDYPGPTMAPGKIPFDTFAADVGVRAGVQVKTVFDLSLRAGGHYDAFLPKNVNNVGTLPRERLLGATLGLRADIAPARSRISVTARFDVLLVGSRAQTAGLEDGQSSTAHAVWGGATIRCALGRHLLTFAAYDFGRATTSWTGQSVRDTAVTSAHRVDTTQVVQIGIGAEL